MPTVSRSVAGVLLGSALALWAFPAHANFTAAPLSPYEGFRVTRVDVAGLHVTHEFVVRREIRIQPADTFRVADAQADLTRLENLGIFSSCVIEAQASDGTVALTYHLREMPWIIPYPRVKYTEQNGWSLGLGVASVNLFGRAMYLSGYFIAGGVDSWAVIYRYPWITGNHLSFDLNASDFRRDDTLNEFQERSLEVTPWVGVWIGDHGRVGATLAYFRMDSDRDGITLSPDRRDRFLRAGARVGYDSRDNWRNPRRGWLQELLFLHSDGSAFDEPGRWWLTELDVRRYQPLAAKQSLVMGGLLSYQEGEVGTDIPTYLQYRMGGANSIRGYDIDVLGKELYGRNQGLVTAEYQYVLLPLKEYTVSKWSFSAGLEAAAFVDWGVAWNHSDEFNGDRARVGWGVGLRWLVPAVFEIRTDVAVGEDDKVYFHLGIGDKLTAQRARIR